MTCITDISCAYDGQMETNNIKLPDINATEICAICDEVFKPEDGYTNAYGTFKCEECLCIDKKRN